MADLNELIDSVAAIEKLSAIPGVERVGLGLKEKAGEVLPEYVFRVYVKQKKPPDELLPEELIPPEIDGIKTDVVVLTDTQLCCQTRVVPGDGISRDREAPGTLGCIVRKAARTFILTNKHVIEAGFTNPSTEVFQPTRSECSGITFNSPVATLPGEDAPWAFKEKRAFDGREYWIDCALVELNSGIGYSNNIDGIGMLQAQIRDMASESSGPGSSSGSVTPTTPPAISKRGKVTDLTHGTVVEFAHRETVEGAQVDLWELVIRPTTGHEYDETYEISTDESASIETILSRFAGQPVTATRVNAADSADRRIHFQGSVFLLPGDSGSICVDSTQHACGLLYLRNGFYLKVQGQRDDIFVPTGPGIACHIRPVFLALGLDLDTAIVVGSSPTSGPIIVTPGDELVAGAPAANDRDLDRFESILNTTAGGRYLRDLFRDHHREVMDLINHRRPVTVTWQRAKGPAFVAAFLNMIRAGETTIPQVVAGHSLSNLIEKMWVVLREQGSDRLRQSIDDDGELLLHSITRSQTFEQFLECLQREKFAAAQV